MTWYLSHRAPPVVCPADHSFAPRVCVLPTTHPPPTEARLSTAPSHKSVTSRQSNTPRWTSTNSENFFIDSSEISCPPSHQVCTVSTKVCGALFTVSNEWHLILGTLSVLVFPGTAPPTNKCYTGTRLTAIAATAATVRVEPNAPSENRTRASQLCVAHVNGTAPYDSRTRTLLHLRRSAP